MKTLIDLVEESIKRPLMDEIAKLMDANVILNAKIDSLEAKIVQLSEQTRVSNKPPIIGCQSCGSDHISSTTDLWFDCGSTDIKRS